MPDDASVPTSPGVAVFRIMISSSPACTPACSMACRAAAVAMEHVLSPSAAMCRDAMPVRSMIHSCDVSIPMAPKSWLDMTFSGAE